jgi:hypothetical protein
MAARYSGPAMKQLDGVETEMEDGLVIFLFGAGEG